MDLKKKKQPKIRDFYTIEYNLEFVLKEFKTYRKAYQYYCYVVCKQLVTLAAEGKNMRG